MEEVEELLDKALSFSGTLGEYSPEALEGLRSAHCRTRQLVGDWDANWPERAEDSPSNDDEVDDAE